MSTRRYDFNDDPREVDLSPELREILLKNGMQCHINMLPDGRHELIVLGHDSPVLRYPISERQVEDLTSWGPTMGHKKAYNTFVDVVKNDFDVPDGYVTASNAFGRVVTGLHGVRLNPGEYGTPRFPFFGHRRGWLGDFLGWGPRSFGHYGSAGWHMRRIDGHMFFPTAGGMMVPERPDGRLKPGEMAPGGYGFYYKGKQQATDPNGLDNIQVDFKPIEAAPRPSGQAVPLSEVVTSDVYFTNDAFQEVMASHGLVVDKEKKTLTVMSQPTRVNMVYQLTDAELATLTANSVSGKNGVSVDKRIATVNAIMANDFAGKVDKNMLESKNLIDVKLKPEVRQEVEAKFIKQDEIMEQKERWRQEQLERDEEDRRYEAAKQRIVDKYKERSAAIAADRNAVDGREIANYWKNRGWVFARGGSNAREMVVGEIRVECNGKDSYVMSAEINGEKTYETISKEQYDRFLAVNDKERLKIFADVYKEDVDVAKRQMPIDPYAVNEKGEVVDREDLVIAHSNSLVANGQEILINDKAFFHEQSHGREVRVDEIRCERGEDGKYMMVAQIDGQEVRKEIDQKAYQKWVYSDDNHRFELFDKQFDDIAIKNVNKRNVLDPMNRLERPMDFAHENIHVNVVSADGGKMSEEVAQNEKEEGTENTLGTSSESEYSGHILPFMVIKSDNALYAGFGPGETLIDCSEDQIFDNNNMRQYKDLPFIDKVEFTQNSLAKAKDVNIPNPFIVFGNKDLYVADKQQGIYQLHSISSDELDILTDTEKWNNDYRKEVVSSILERPYIEKQTISEWSIDNSKEGKAVITATIGGTTYQQEISDKEFDKLLAVDDKQRGRLVAKLFDLDLNSEQKSELGAEVMKRITAGGGDLSQQSQSRPEVYKSETTTENVNVKEMAAANYSQIEEETQTQTLEETQARGMGV